MSRGEDINHGSLDEVLADAIASQPEVDLLVELATNFEATVNRLPNGKGEQYMQEHREVTACRKRADLGRITLL